MISTLSRDNGAISLDYYTERFRVEFSPNTSSQRPQTNVLRFVVLAQDVNTILSDDRSLYAFRRLSNYYVNW